ncbi:hypothetical protein [Actinophytocola sp. NPDC049390]|uniref:hypothetical protein n=1 Tax=Actinophytocola sp. NPDC049390 TaxID=3363894 RepID=UPI0037AF86C9
MNDRGVLGWAAVPAPRRGDTEPVRVTCEGVGQPPLPVLARVQHVFCGPVAGVVWPMLRGELRAGSVAAGELVLLRIGRGTAETWTELVVAEGRVY